MNDVVERAKNIVLTPRTEWAAIEMESASVQEIYTRYVIPLALIPAIASFIGASIVGITIPGLGTVRTGFFSGLVQGIVQFGLSLAMVYVLALIIDALAPTFGARKNPLAAFKVAAYSMTPAWLAGIFSLVPSLSFLGILGLYAIYLLYLGLPPLMRAPEDKAVGYTAVIAISAVVLSIVVAGIVGAILS